MALTTEQKTLVAAKLKEAPYADLAKIAADRALAELFVEPTATLIDAELVDKGDLLVAFAGALLVLPTLPVDLQTKWDRVFTLFGAMPEKVKLSSQIVKDILIEGINDGVLQKSILDTVTQRPATVAEVLLGPGVSLTAEDIGACR